MPSDPEICVPTDLLALICLIQGKKMEDEFSLFDYSVKVFK